MLSLASVAVVAWIGLTAGQWFDPGGGDGNPTPLPAARGPERVFALGFEQLHQQIGDVMGVPVEDEHVGDDQDMVQRTTTGLAVWKDGQQPHFTDGWHTWSLADPDPPLTAATGPPASTGPPIGVWDRLAACEASGIWGRNSGNGYYGGLQEDMTFWRNYGGLAYAARPDLASRAAQIEVAIRGQAKQGWGAWPVCSRVVGLR